MATLQFLGCLSDKFGREVQIDFPEDLKTLSDIRSWLNRHFKCDDFSDPATRAIVNDQVVTDMAAVSNADHIAFFPPVGGG